MRKTTRFALVASSAVAALMIGACSNGTTTPEDPEETTTATAGETASEEESAPAENVEPTVMKLALNQPEDHVSYIALEAFGEDLKEATDGRWDIEVHANSTLGNQDEYVQSVGQGVIDMAVVSAPQLENLSKDFTIFSLPTVFESIDHQMKVLADDEIVGDLYTSLEDSNGITVVGGLTQGARSIYTKDAIAQTPEDLAGKKIRVQESPSSSR